MKTSSCTTGLYIIKQALLYVQKFPIHSINAMTARTFNFMYRNNDHIPEGGKYLQYTNVLWFEIQC